MHPGAQQAPGPQAGLTRAQCSVVAVSVKAGRERRGKTGCEGRWTDSWTKRPRTMRSRERQMLREQGEREAVKECVCACTRGAHQQHGPRQQPRRAGAGRGLHARGPPGACWGAGSRLCAWALHGWRGAGLRQLGRGGHRLLLAAAARRRRHRRLRSYRRCCTLAAAVHQFFDGSSGSAATADVAPAAALPSCTTRARGWWVRQRSNHPRELRRASPNHHQRDAQAGMQAGSAVPLAPAPPATPRRCRRCRRRHCCWRRPQTAAARGFRQSGGAARTGWPGRRTASSRSGLQAGRQGGAAKGSAQHRRRKGGSRTEGTLGILARQPACAHGAQGAAKRGRQACSSGPGGRAGCQLRTHPCGTPSQRRARPAGTGRPRRCSRRPGSCCGRPPSCWW